MSKERITVKTLKTNTAKVLEIDIYYTKGGMCFGTGQNNPRGYYLSVSPVEHTAPGVTCYTLFSGVATFVEEAKRFNEKRLKELAAIAMELSQLPSLIDKVCQKNNLVVVEETATV